MSLLFTSPQRRAANVSHDICFDLSFLTVNCWPNEDGRGGCDVNIEYELQIDDMELIDVTISIPVPSGVGAPNVADIDGDFKHDSRRNILDW